jgi:hypothetical protein
MNEFNCIYLFNYIEMHLKKTKLSLIIKPLSKEETNIDQVFFLLLIEEMMFYFEKNVIIQS